MARKWSYILLFCFVFLTLPKEMFHNHEEHYHEQSQGDCIEDGGCFVCDFDYTSLTAPISIAEFNLICEYQKTNAYLVEDQCTRSIVHIPSRGPPAIS